MKVIEVYKQYFAADCVFNGVQRNGVSVVFTATSEDGNIKYDVSVSFFPHEDETDFRISYDAYAEKNVFSGRGRRSRKKEAVYLDGFRKDADSLAGKLGGVIFWDRPLIEARYG